MKSDLFEIAAQMRKSLPDAFVARALYLAHEFRGLGDLMVLWYESDPAERAEIVADIDALLTDVGDHAPSRRQERCIRFDDLDAIAADVMAFKDRLRIEVEKRTTLTGLAATTGMPLPSLSRFFSQPSMPRRSTLLKIAHALDLNEVEIANDWTVA